MASSEINWRSSERRLAPGRSDLMPNSSKWAKKKIMRACDKMSKGAGRLGVSPHSCACSKHVYGRSCSAS